MVNSAYGNNNNITDNNTQNDTQNFKFYLKILRLRENYMFESEICAWCLNLTFFV